MNNVVSLNNIIKGACMKIRNESINKNYLIPSVITTLGIATVFGVGIYNATNIANTSNANALSYSTSKDISFTFAPTLSIGLSTDSLTIDNLVPGTTSDSNTVSVTVSSNTPYGYVLSAGVGSTLSTDPYYNTSDLVHDNSTTQVPTTNKFSSISTSASLESLTTDNTWGYSTSTDGGTNWSTYSGLSHAETKPLLDISDPAQPSTIDFKIAARSASTQASGTYNNVITFYAVGKAAPAYMQEPEVIKTRLKNVGDELQAIDQRDGKEYWVRKMADGNIWMTQNLDLELDSTKTYTPADTDISANWQPERSTVEFIMGNRFNGWKQNAFRPYSASPGELYVYIISGTEYEKYTSMADCQDAHPDCDAHSHVGNYYNWPAAVAGNTHAYYLTYQYRDAPGSICPAGWRLPKITGNDSITSNSEWGGLLVGESIIANPVDDGQSYSSGGFNRSHTAPLWLTWSGYIYETGISGYGQLSIYNYAAYWSSTVATVGAYSLVFNTDYVNPAYDGNNKNMGLPVRCLVK